MLAAGVLGGVELELELELLLGGVELELLLEGVILSPPVPKMPF